MAAERLPDAVREFTDYLRDLLASLDRYGGWCLVFWQRDPDGMRACLEGREPPPWDVLESLLQDLATAYGPGAAEAETPTARALHTAALEAYDARRGAREALSDRLDVMLREQRYAAERRTELTRRLAAAATREEAGALRTDLAWAEDDHARATARCAEIHARLAAVDHRARSTGHPRGRYADLHPAPGAQGGARHAPGENGAPDAFRPAPPRPGHEPVPAPAPTPTGYGSDSAGRAAPARGRDRREGGVAESARGGGAEDRNVGGSGSGDGPGASVAGWGVGEGVAGESARGAGGGDVGGPGPGDAVRGVGSGQAAAVPGPPEAARAAGGGQAGSKGRKRRRGGARFAGVADDEGSGPVVVPPAAVPSLPAAPAASRGARFAGGAEPEPVEEPRPELRPGPADRQAAGRVVAALARLRREARGGEAHALLTETAYAPAVRFPLLADEMRRAGLGADWATLLWEAAASLPTDRLVAVAGALSAAGRAQDAEQVLRQGVVRPADEIGRAVLTLTAGTRHREARALLDACVRTRTPEDAARTAAPDPHRLVPLLLTAAQGVSDERHRDLLHALRVAGLAA